MLMSCQTLPGSVRDRSWAALRKRRTCRSRCICVSIADRPAISCLSAVRRAVAGSLLKMRPIIELVDCSGALSAASASVRRRTRSARARLSARSADRIVASLTGSLIDQR